MPEMCEMFVSWPARSSRRSPGLPNAPGTGWLIETMNGTVWQLPADSERKRVGSIANGRSRKASGSLDSA